MVRMKDLSWREVELESEEESFVKPDFIGKEVTGDALLQLPTNEKTV